MLADLLLDLLITYRIPALFFGFFLFGEISILAGVVLAIEGEWSLWTVFFTSYAAWLVLDTFWFLVARYAVNVLPRWPRLKRIYDQGHAWLRRVHINEWRYQALYIISFKFFYGIRFAIMIALGMSGIPFLRFMLFDLIGTAVFVALIVTAGAYIWGELTSAYSTIQAIGYGLTALVIITLALRIGFPLLREKIARKRNNS